MKPKVILATVELPVGTMVGAGEPLNGGLMEVLEDQAGLLPRILLGAPLDQQLDHPISRRFSWAALGETVDLVALRRRVDLVAGPLVMAVLRGMVGVQV